jgi:hypothetical protein
MAITVTRTSFELQNWSEVGSGTLPATSAPIEQYIQTHSTSESDHYVTQQLDATDRGFPAWRVLIGGFVFEALLWGNSPSSGTGQCLSRARNLLLRDLGRTIRS